MNKSDTLLMPEDEITELIWQNCLVALPLDRPSAAENGGGVGLAAEEAEVAKRQFMEEDEMASWLNCQMEDVEVEGGVCLQGELDLRDEADATPARLKPTTVVESNVTPVAIEALEGSVMFGSSEKLADVVILDEPRPTFVSSSGNAERKRKKAIEDAKFESGEEQKDPSKCASVRKPRTAESHNLSERRRRDRINMKMKALQELIPKCNKSDKVSMLDEAIEYMKSLQCQLQIMSMGCNANPLMYPGIPAYLPPMGMGVHMGLSMGLGLGMSMRAEMGTGGLSCPMLPFGPIPFPAMAGYPSVQLGSRPLSPQFHPFPVPTSSQVRGEAINQQDQFSDSVHRQSPNAPQIPHVADPCRQFLNIQHSLVQTQNRVPDEAGIRREDGSADDSDSYNG